MEQIGARKLHKHLRNLKMASRLLSEEESLVHGTGSSVFQSFLSLSQWHVPVAAACIHCFLADIKSRFSSSIYNPALLPSE